MLKPFLAVAAGVVAGVVMVMLGDFAASTVYKWPDGLDYNNKEAVRSFVQQAPMSASLVMLMGQFLAGFAAGWVANRLSVGTRYRPALVAGFGILAAAVANLFQVPGHPAWYWAANIALVVLGAWLGGRAGFRGERA